MKHFEPVVSVLLLLSCLSVAACRTTPLPGVEVGNPSKSSVSFKIVPEEGDQVYQVTLLESNQALVEKMRRTDDGDTFVEAVTVPYRQNDRDVTLSATFSDESTLGLTATLDDLDSVVSHSVRVNGDEVVACVEDRIRTRCRVDS